MNKYYWTTQDWQGNFTGLEKSDTLPVGPYIGMIITESLTKEDWVWTGRGWCLFVPTQPSLDFRVSTLETKVNELMEKLR